MKEKNKIYVLIFSVFETTRDKSLPQSPTLLEKASSANF